MGSKFPSRERTMSDSSDEEVMTVFYQFDEGEEPSGIFIRDDAGPGDLINAVKQRPSYSDHRISKVVETSIVVRHSKKLHEKKVKKVKKVGGEFPEVKSNAKLEDNHTYLIELPPTEHGAIVVATHLHGDLRGRTLKFRDLLPREIQEVTRTDGGTFATLFLERIIADVASIDGVRTRVCVGSQGFDPKLEMTVDVHVISTYVDGPLATQLCGEDASQYVGVMRSGGEHDVLLTCDDDLFVVKVKPDSAAVFRRALKKVHADDNAGQTRVLYGKGRYVIVVGVEKKPVNGAENDKAKCQVLCLYVLKAMESAQKQWEEELKDTDELPTVAFFAYVPFPKVELCAMWRNEAGDVQMHWLHLDIDLETEVGRTRSTKLFTQVGQYVNEWWKRVPSDADLSDWYFLSYTDAQTVHVKSESSKKSSNTTAGESSGRTTRSQTRQDETRRQVAAVEHKLRKRGVVMGKPMNILEVVMADASEETRARVRAENAAAMRLRFGVHQGESVVMVIKIADCDMYGLAEARVFAALAAATGATDHLVVAHHVVPVRSGDDVLVAFVLERLLPLREAAVLLRRTEGAAAVTTWLRGCVLPGLLRGMAQLRELGWCHGDIKPSNAGAVSVGGPVKLFDFGHACEAGVLSTHPRTTGYDAPETRESRAYDPLRADVWALARTVRVLQLEYGEADGKRCKDWCRLEAELAPLLVDDPLERKLPALDAAAETSPQQRRRGC